MAKTSEFLTENFVVELFSAALERRLVFDIVKQYMKFSYLQVESEKKLWQWVSKRHSRTGNIPTIGLIQQHFSDDEKVLEKLEEIADIEIDEKGGHQDIVKAFETFIKKMKFLEANDKITDVYNRGDKEKAWDLFVQYAEDFNNFTIEDAKFETVFADFHVRQAKRASEDWKYRYKIPTTIDELDYLLGGDSGGPETGECFLWLGDSGSGKSQVLVHLGVASARQGFRTAHFQLEGTKEQCLNRYDAAWTGTLYQDVKLGAITAKKMRVTKRIVSKLKQSDIIVSSEEEWGGKSLADVRRELQTMQKKYGKIDTIIIDYLELLEVGDGHNYSPGEERFRQAKLAKGMKALAMEFNAVVHTATQSSNVPEEFRNDPEFVITRDKLNEDKGKMRPFDYLVTLNQTRDEKKDEVMRLYGDKFRDYKSGQVIHICNNFSYARFYDRKRTMATDWEEYEADQED